MSSISLPEKVQYIIQTLSQQGYEAFAVGGCVRDSLMDRLPEDWDITTSAKPEQVKELFSHTIDTGIEHGTVTVMLEKEGFEVTTYRIDGEYEDYRHPKQVEFTSNLTEDLRRRDFTINALAYNDTSGIIDAFHGIEDMQQRIIRCVGDAGERFDEDALRIMRAVRFSAQLDFSIEPATLSAIQSHAPELSRISAERIRTELTKLLLSAHPGRLMTAYETGLTAVILPEFDRMCATSQENPHHIYDVGTHCLQTLLFVAQESMPGGRLEQLDKKSQLWLRYAALLHDVGKPETKTIDTDGTAHFYGHAEAGSIRAKEILRRLKFDNDTVHAVSHLIAFHDYRYSDGQSPVTGKTMRRALNRIGIELLPLHFLLQEADLRAQNPALLADKLSQLRQAHTLADQILANRECVTLKMLAVNGNDLIQNGIRPGRQVGELLSALLALVLEQPELNTKETLLAALPELTRHHPSHHETCKSKFIE